MLPPFVGQLAVGAAVNAAAEKSRAEPSPPV
jgi:hypothetical protein